MVKKIWPLFFIFIIWLVFSAPFFFENKIPFPSTLLVNNYTGWSEYPKFWGPVSNPATPDVIDQIMPWKKLTIDSWKNGEIPLWNPYSFSGTPHLANYQSGVFSPTNIFFFVFDFNTAWGLAVLAQPILAGIFMFLFTRSLKLSRIASLISSIAFMFSGFITVWMSYTTLSLAITFLPLALFAIEKYFDKKTNVLYLVLLSITFPLSFFSGHFQTSLYFLFFVFAFLFFKFYETKNKKLFLNSFVFSILGVLITFPQILPSIELYKESVRSSSFQKINALPIKYLPTIIAPDFYGNPVTRNNFFGNYIEWTGFTGTLPFLLGLYSLSSKTKKVLFFFIMGILSLLLALNTPVVDLLVGLRIPVLSTSAVGRVLVLFSFSFAVLAGFGLDVLASNLKNHRTKKIYSWLILFGFIFIAIWIFIFSQALGEDFKISLKNFILPSIFFAIFALGSFMVLFKKRLLTIFLVVILLLVAFDMLRFATKWQPFDDKNLTFIKTPIIEKLENLDNNYRTYGPYRAEINVYFNTLGTEGYDPLYIGRYGELINSLDNGKITKGPKSGIKIATNDKYFPKIFDFLGIKYILQKKLDRGQVWDFPFNNFENDKFKLIYREKDFFIHENRNAYPRAFLVGNWEVIKDNQKILDKILSKNFDLKKSAVIEKNPGINRVGDINGNVKIISYTPNKIILQTNSNKNGLLVISDNYYPGWHAKVNGNKQEVLRTNYTFRGTALPIGNNQVELFYKPSSFMWGVTVAAISIIILSLTIIKWYTTKKKVKIKRTSPLTPRS